eukprot:CAMPEP_0115431372 /NCGR_PEP_ID=MMETSP0271-20121206/31534_1 /TAXON_ID=71861 /ORGANISM="Scrippsiella trochoidea, Strain CCMP3099" /LENGTH=31 /DNA_ID= /DNA_START= /DNA_END= /DNA_ORIENTATION=
MGTELPEERHVLVQPQLMPLADGGRLAAELA